MRRDVLASVATIIVMGCSGRTIQDAPGHRRAPDAGSPDSGASANPEAGVEASVVPPASTVPTPPYVPGHYGACPDVYASPVAGLSSDDPGSPGLDELRVRVLQSREAFNAYAAAHGNTYSYTRYKVDAPPGQTTKGRACKDTVNVTGRVVTSVTTASVPEGGGPWSEPALITTFDAFNTCFPPVTMDFIYDQCLNETLCQDPRANRLFVQIDARGLLVKCSYVPASCTKDCYRGVGDLLLTVDGSDWTKPLPGCCTPAPQPDCCMTYGGFTGNRDGSIGSCGTNCDGMPPPDCPGWEISFDAHGCAIWNEPAEGTFTGCCGCRTPPMR